jgi:hypothetical protein
MVPNESDVKQIEERELSQSMKAELSDEQLEQFAEGSCSWGASCTSGNTCR